MVPNAVNVMEPELGEALLWNDAFDPNDWIVEYSKASNVAGSERPVINYYHIYGLKNAILKARQIADTIFFCVPDRRDEYIDITSDADAILVLFQYENQ